MREYGSNINLPSLDNLFSSEQERQDGKVARGGGIQSGAMSSKEV